MQEVGVVTHQNRADAVVSARNQKRALCVGGDAVPDRAGQRAVGGAETQPDMRGIFCSHIRVPFIADESSVGNPRTA